MTSSHTTSVLSDNLLPTRPLVLLVEDEPAQAYLVRRQLLERGETSFDISSTGSLAEARMLLDGGLHPDVILLDLNLPDSSGSATVASCIDLCDAPIVVLTGADDIAEIQTAIDSGAEDYLVKGADSSTLRRAIRYAILRHRRDTDHRLAMTVFNHAQEGVIITSATGIILNVNKAFCQISGFDPAQLIGNSLELFHEQGISRIMSQQLQHQDHWQGEFRCQRPDQKTYEAALTISRVNNKHGQTTHLVGLLSDITLRKQQEKQLRHLAHHDQLTGLPNRTLFSDRLHQLMARVARTGNQLALAYIDLDGFKLINDHHGHDAGDRLLIALADRLLHAVREVDTVARIGGDEFAVILADLGPSAAETRAILERLLHAAAAMIRTGDLTLQVSASIGVSFYPQISEIGIDQLLRQADQAMYQAKLAGKNRYCFYCHELNG